MPVDVLLPFVLLFCVAAPVVCFVHRGVTRITRPHAGIPWLAEILLTLAFLLALMSVEFSGPNGSEITALLGVVCGALGVVSYVRYCAATPPRTGNDAGEGNDDV